MVLAVVTDLVAAHAFAARSCGKLVDGVGGTDGWVFAGIGAGLAALLLVDGGGFQGPDAEETPAGDGHGFDEHVLAWGRWFEFVDERGEEMEEARFGFAFDQDGVGEESVSHGVAGGVATAAGGFGASGFGRVRAIRG